MKRRTKKKTVSEAESTFGREDIWYLIKQILEKTVITIFWENVDKLEKKVKITLHLGLKFVIGIIAVFTGLIFLLTGASKAIDSFLGLGGGIGYIIVGMFTVFAGIWVVEKTKNESEKKEE